MQGFVLNTRNLCGYILPPAVREKIVILEYSVCTVPYLSYLESSNTGYRYGKGYIHIKLDSTGSMQVHALPALYVLATVAMWVILRLLFMGAVFDGPVDGGRVRWQMGLGLVLQF